FIYVTHDQVEAMTMGDRIAVMRNGEVQQCASPQEIFDRPANRFVAGFIGSPPMNFIDALLVDDDEELSVESEGLAVVLPERFREIKDVRERANGPIVFGIRPTDIHDSSLPGPVTPQTGNLVRTQVEVVEPMGAESMVYLRAGEHDLVASLDSATCAEEGAELEVALNLDRAHLFDAETGDTLA
ncbi:MAG: TOBE domain-containing protein, partial [Armatimonadia bacterium]|nr:TOBE domain-containing protein [Armatimonadia bacterium]